MVKVYVVIGNQNGKWIEELELESRKTAFTEAKNVVNTFNNNLRPGELKRSLWCVVPERPYRPKNKKPDTLVEDSAIHFRSEVI
jgi:hypothetical protein